ncbi:MAG: pyridoxamine 5'-phosphate oxidase family protein [Deltaproteobacteria bacterium]|nr:pyridoxamine 5'-phosphate oxidase family protein [Deltaproteobacteria bacterium]
MAKITAEMRSMINANQCFVATSDRTGKPNIGPKKSTKVLDDETLLFIETTGRKTLENIKENPLVAIAVVDKERLVGFRFVGHAEIITSGHEFEYAKQLALQANRPAPKAVITVKVEEIHNLRPGETAGQRIG